MTTTPEVMSNQPKVGTPPLEQTTKTPPLSAISPSPPPQLALFLHRHPANLHPLLQLPPKPAVRPPQPLTEVEQTQVVVEESTLLPSLTAPLWMKSKRQ